MWFGVSGFLCVWWEPLLQWAPPYLLLLVQEGGLSRSTQQRAGWVYGKHIYNLTRFCHIAFQVILWDLFLGNFWFYCYFKRKFFFKVSFPLLLVDQNIMNSGILVLNLANVLCSLIHYNNLSVNILRFSG